MRSSISQMKSSVESLSSRKDQIENRTHRWSRCVRTVR
jgi:hypothetical protein